MVTLTKKQKLVMAATGHLLVTGGPGSGKTTVSILKAASIAEHCLRPGQRVLFLSFARATVSRVIEAIEREQPIASELKSRILVETYHAFFWRMLKAHGYLVGLPRRLYILLPQNEAIALSSIRNEYEAENKLDGKTLTEKNERVATERLRLAVEEGHICFDLFAHFAGKVLHGSRRIQCLTSLMFPYIVLDEFQDTNGDQWDVVKAISNKSVVCALADPEQRIYDWIGADPERLDHFRKHCAPVEFDLGKANHRNADTEIRMFGDDVLRKRFQKTAYNGVQIHLYESNQNQALTKLVTCVLQARKRLLKTGSTDWTLAVLTPTKRLMRQVSDTFRSPPANLPEIRHTAAVEVEGAILGAELLAFVIQRDVDGDHMSRFIEMLCNFYRGKGGDTPSKTALNEADRIGKAYDDYVARLAKGQKIRENSLLLPTFGVYGQARAVPLSGNPDTDWLAIRKVFDDGKCNRLKAVAEELRNIRLLNRGAQLRQALSEDWREHGSYLNAVQLVRQTFVQEHFAMARRPETGIIVMNMHKAKGKQFDEVIVFDGWPRFVHNKIVSNPDRIVHGNLRTHDNDQARQNFRVSVTRAKQKVAVLTPKQDPCILLLD